MIAYLVKGYVVKCLSFRFTNDLGTPINHLGTPILTVNFLNALNSLDSEQWLKSKGSKKSDNISDESDNISDKSDNISGKSEALYEVTFLGRNFTKNLFLGQLNVNSVRNKFEALEFLIKDKFDVFLVSKGKLDSSFPEAQFKIPGYRIFGQDQDKYGGGLMFYTNLSSLHPL